MSRFIEIDGNPVPADAEITDVHTNGATLRVAFFPSQNAQRVIVLAPGWSEFIEKYFEAVSILHSRRVSRRHDGLA